MKLQWSRWVHTVSIVTAHNRVVMCVCVCRLSKGYSHLWRVCVAYDAGLLLQPLHSCNGNMHAARCTMLRAFSEFHEIAPTQPTPPPLGHTLTHLPKTLLPSRLHTSILDHLMTPLALLSSFHSWRLTTPAHIHWQPQPTHALSPTHNLLLLPHPIPCSFAPEQGCCALGQLVCNLISSFVSRV